MMQNERIKLVRVTTVPMSLSVLLTGQMRFISESGFDVLMVSADGPEIPLVVEREGCEHRVVQMTRSITPLSDLYSLYLLVRLFKEQRPHIVHSHTPKAGLLGMIAGRLAGVPICIHTVAGIPALARKGAFRRLLLSIESLTYFFAHRVFPNSMVLMSIISKEGLCDIAKLSVIGYGSSNGIDTGHFSRSESIAEEAKVVREKYHISSDALVLCFVGRIVSDKGINELVRVFSRLKSLDGRLVLLLVGATETDLDPLEDETIELLKHCPGIVLTGFQSDVRPFMCASDIFVFPSHREGFPNVVMQAACMELPIIATDINGCNEIVSHGESGLLVKVSDEEMLFDAISELVKDTERRLDMGSKAREGVVGRYERSYVQNQILQEYRRLLEENSFHR
jgi:glycosyltransferase involved in cell wall biosynthesis